MKLKTDVIEINEYYLSEELKAFLIIKLLE